MFTQKRMEAFESTTPLQIYRAENRHKELCDQEKRLWLSVILKAVEDLEDPYIDVPTNADRYSFVMNEVKESARRFLSGLDGSIYDICSAVEINADYLVSCYKTFGAAGLRAKLAEYYRKIGA